MGGLLIFFLLAVVTWFAAFVVGNPWEAFVLTLFTGYSFGRLFRCAVEDEIYGGPKYALVLVFFAAAILSFTACGFLT